MSKESKAFTGTRRGDGGTYLIIADKSDEFDVAMHYACALAQTRRGHVAVAHITDLEDFVHWGKVEAMMRNDLRAEAEREIWQIAKTINETYGLMPSLYIREGKVLDRIVEIIEEERLMRSLILASSKNNGNPGPLISYFTNKGISRLRVPVVIVPGHFDKEQIEAVINPLHLD